jgi:mycobactin phenyloxazoline synthetase
VLDRDFNHRPDHVAGELYIAGDGLAVGYFRDEVRTREKFFEHPRTGERLYRTGDWGRYWGDGTLEFLGRQDTQVKIRGFRIELGEIDAALRKLPQVEESLSLTFGEGSGKSLAAFVRRKAGTSTAAVPYPDLLEHLLPGYMIPSVILEIDEFPLTPNGKVNRSALLQRIQLSDAPEARVETRLTPLESGIMKIWKDILDPPRLDRTTNFFHAGGNSILAITMINEIEAAHQVRMPLSVLYQRQTVAQIAEYLETYRPAKQDVLVPIHQEGKGRKLFLVHPIGGGILCYAPAAEVFKSDFDIIAVQSLSQAHPGSTPARIEEMAEAYADRVASENGCQEVSLLGWSMGGLLSIAMKGILERKGLRVRVVALDPWIAKADPQSCDYSPALAVAEFFKDLNWGKAPSGHFQFRSQDTATMLLEYKDHLEQAAAGPATFHADTLAQLFEEYDRNLRAILGYAVPSLDRDVALFRAGRTDRAGFRFLRPITDALEPLAQAGAVLVDENHFSIVGEGFLRSRKAQLLGMLAHTGNEAEEIHIGSHRDMPLHRQPVPASHHHGPHERLHLASKKDTGKPAAISSPKHQEN